MSLRARPAIQWWRSTGSRIKACPGLDPGSGMTAAESGMTACFLVRVMSYGKLNSLNGLLWHTVLNGQFFQSGNCVTDWPMVSFQRWFEAGRLVTKECAFAVMHSAKNNSVIERE